MTRDLRHPMSLRYPVLISIPTHETLILYPLPKEPHKRDDILQKRPVYEHDTFTLPKDMYRVAKIHRIPYLYTSHFPQKWPILSASFVENDLQVRGSYEFSWKPWIPCPLPKEPYKRDDVLQKRPVFEHETFILHPLPKDSIACPLPVVSCWEWDMIAYGVVTISRLLKTIGLFCRISSLL